MGFRRDLEILIDEISDFDLKHSSFVYKEIFGGVASSRRCAAERGCGREDKDRQLAAALRLCTDNLAVPNKEERP
jgi:hypothetical protein